MIYAGIGSRKTPEEILRVMEIFATFSAPVATLRSGGAPGADQAFEFGAILGGGRMETYLPWKGFEGIQDGAITKPSKLAMEIAEQYHPNWDRLSQGARKLMARNSYQILGSRLNEDDISDLVVCWTSDGKASGGTGQAIRIAADYDVPVLNLQREDDYHYMCETLGFQE